MGLAKAQRDEEGKSQPWLGLRRLPEGTGLQSGSPWDERKCGEDWLAVKVT